jgi:hypothetical protein
MWEYMDDSGVLVAAVEHAASSRFPGIAAQASEVLRLRRRAHAGPEASPTRDATSPMLVSPVGT